MQRRAAARPTTRSRPQSVRRAAPARAAPAEQAEADKPVPPPFSIVRSEAVELWLKLLVYAAYGAGKTTLASTATEVDEMNDVLYIDAEGGSLVLPEGMDTVPIRRYSELARVTEFLRLHCLYRDSGDDVKLAELESTLRGEHVEPGEAKHYRTLIIDSLSEVYTFLSYQILSIDYERQKLDYELEGMEGKDYGRAGEMVQLLVRKMRDLPMHVIFICSEEEKEEGKGDTKKVTRRPALPGKLGNKVQGFVTILGYLETKFTNDKRIARRLWLQAGHPRFQAKMRVRRELQATAPKYLDEPTMGALLELSRKFPPPAGQRARVEESETDASTEDSFEEEFIDDEPPRAADSASRPPAAPARAGAAGRRAARRPGRPVRGR